jgi:hypothetical protein
MLLTQALVRQLFNYHAATGVLTWRVTPSRRMHAGDRAGTEHYNKRYNKQGKPESRVICIDYQRYRETNIIWLWMTGVWPTHDVDHADVNPFNNAWSNLRLATRSENIANQKSQRPGKLKWAYKTKEGNYQSKVQMHGVSHFLGTYSTEQEAHDRAYVVARRLHKQFVRR